MRLRRLLLAAVAAVLAILIVRRRRSTEFVEIDFDDGSSVRLTGRPEARDLLDDADAILAAA